MAARLCLGRYLGRALYYTIIVCVNMLSGFLGLDDMAYGFLVLASDSLPRGIFVLSRDSRWLTLSRVQNRKREEVCVSILHLLGFVCIVINNQVIWEYLNPLGRWSDSRRLGVDVGVTLYIFSGTKHRTILTLVQIAPSSKLRDDSLDLLAS